jgi:hypothetical protein
MLMKHGPHNQACDPPLRHYLTRSRCQSLGDDEYHPGRILCFYWGTIRGRGAAIPIRHDCSYFRPTRRGWEVDAYPDWDVCEG